MDQYGTGAMTSRETWTELENAGGDGRKARKKRATNATEHGTGKVGSIGHSRVGHLVRIPGITWLVG
jgi:hypothetical protein